MLRTAPTCNRTIVTFSASILLLALFFAECRPARAADAVKTAEAASLPWKAGIASQAITPSEMVWMAGYASRTKPAEGIASELFGKAVWLEDTTGGKLLIVTLDLIGVPRRMRAELEAELGKRLGLSPAQMLFNASHTHCGPVLVDPKGSFYAFDDDQKAKLVKYYDRLVAALVELAERAKSDAAPAKLGYTHARCGFAMNRRLPSMGGYNNSPYPDGPVDQSVPVLRITGADGKVRAVLFGYACHNTTLGFFEFCADYAGFAQTEIEKAHPGTTALFVMGCGGDQNPYPRGKIEQARLHGAALASAVDVALLVEPTEIRPPLKTWYETTPLPFAPAPSKEKLEEMASKGTGYEQRHAQRLLARIAEEGKLPTHYDYPIQVVRFGGDLTMVALAGEVVVDYSLRIKRELAGERVWVAGYSNDVFGYVPSLRVLKEGGYEGGGAMLYTNLPGPFGEEVEERIIGTVKRLK